MKLEIIALLICSIMGRTRIRRLYATEKEADEVVPEN
jgi:hypothetical protein